MSLQAPLSPPKRPPAIGPKPTNGGSTTPTAKREFKIDKGRRVDAQKIVIYGTGGVGKSSLAAAIGQVGAKPLFLDIGEGSKFLDVDRVSGLVTWDDLRAVLHNDEMFVGYSAIVIDDLTKAEELATEWTIDNVKHEKGHKVSSVEGYGFGKGVTHVYETFLQLLGDLDHHHRHGRHVICVAHECTANVPNPTGQDFIRYEPRLQSPASGKASVRHRVKEWCDHMLYIGYDVTVDDNGVAVGASTRTVYPVEMPAWLAKSRSISDPIVYTKDSAEVWEQLLGVKSE